MVDCIFSIIQFVYVKNVKYLSSREIFNKRFLKIKVDFIYIPENIL